jgi:hypothetical protein
MAMDLNAQLDDSKFVNKLTDCTLLQKATQPDSIISQKQPYLQTELQVKACAYNEGTAPDILATMRGEHLTSQLLYTWKNVSTAHIQCIGG